MPQDPLMNPGSKASRELFGAISHVCVDKPIEDVLAACMNMIANCIRQTTGLRTEAEERMNMLFGQTMTLLMEHYDPVTNRRRSVVPFNQVISPAKADFRSVIRGMGKGNGHT